MSKAELIEQELLYKNLIKEMIRIYRNDKWYKPHPIGFKDYIKRVEDSLGLSEVKK